MLSSSDQSESVLSLRFYNPLKGEPRIQKFVPKMIFPEFGIDAWVPYLPQGKASNNKVISDTSETIMCDPSLVTIIIDSARFLPEEVSATKLYATLYSPTLNRRKEVKFDQQINLSTRAYMPVYATKMSFLKEDVLHDSFLIVKILTCDKLKLEVMTVGYFHIQLALKPEDARDDVEFRLGAFQVPIMVSEKSRDELLDVENTPRVSRVPCASILYRLIESVAGMA